MNQTNSRKNNINNCPSSPSIQQQEATNLNRININNNHNNKGSPVKTILISSIPTPNEIYSNYSSVTKQIIGLQQNQQKQQQKLQSKIKNTNSSGSETDVSTSTENLSPEEHYVLKNSKRQEPQGEETCLGYDFDSTPTGTMNNNTLIIHGNDSLNNSIYSYMKPLFLSECFNK